MEVFFTAARAGTNNCSIIGESKGDHDVWLLKLDASLNIEWQKLIGGSKYDAGGYGLTELEDGGYILNGCTESYDKDVHGFDFPDIPNQWDNWVVRLDSAGNIIWDIALGGDSFESTSKVFPNDDGTFTVFGSTSSSNNGDVEGNHYYVYYPNYPGYDIWMVHLSENGELLDQRCFGNAAYNLIYRGITKISDSHYLLAGSGVSRQADPDQPEAPTEGEVWCGWESTSKDIWFFEIVDCEYFQPEVPANIEGEDSICTLNTTESIYTTQIINPQYEEAQWQMIPAEAGELTNLQDSAIIHWNSSFEGQVELSVRSSNSCGESDYSEPKIITVRSCVGIGEIHQKQLKTYPNPARDYIIFEYDIAKEYKTAQLQIYDGVKSNLLMQQNIKEKQNSISIGVKDWTPGVYIASIVVDGKILKSIKFTVVGK